MSWRSEFGSGYEVPTDITSDPELIDQSWHNDTCPSFSLSGQPEIEDSQWWRLWVEHPDRDQREYPQQERFTVCTQGLSDTSIAYEGTDVIAAIAALKAKRTPALPPDGWTDWSTGGGCTAWMREVTKAGHYALITVTDDAQSPERLNQAVVIGFYTPDTDPIIAFNCETATDAVHLASRIFLIGDNVAPLPTEKQS